jgi:hypothetical protein
MNCARARHDAWQEVELFLDALRDVLWEIEAARQRHLHPLGYDARPIRGFGEAFVTILDEIVRGKFDEPAVWQRAVLEQLRERANSRLHAGGRRSANKSALVRRRISEKLDSGEVRLGWPLTRITRITGLDDDIKAGEVSLSTVVKVFTAMRKERRS